MNNRESKEEAILKVLLSKALDSDDFFPTSDEAIERLMAETEQESLREGLLQEIKQRLFNGENKKENPEKRKRFLNVAFLPFSKPALAALFREKKKVNPQIEEKLKKHREKIIKEQSET